MTNQQPNPYEAAYPTADEPKGRKVWWLLWLVIFGALALVFVGGIVTYTARARAMDQATRARMEAEQAAAEAEQAAAEAERLRAEKGE